MTRPNRRVASYLGRVLDEDGDPVGTCFQLLPGVLVTAWHVLDQLGASGEDAVVQVDPLQGGAARQARLVRTDPLHDLAVLMTGEPLASCAPRLTAADEVEIGTPVVVTGVAMLDDPAHSHRYLDADGHWAGGSTLDDQIPVGRIEARAVMPGMSGASVVTRPPAPAGPMVAGVISARYNSRDGWGRDTAWVARAEDLVPLLAGLGDVTLHQRAWAEATELTLSVTGADVRLHGEGVEASEPHSGVTPALADALRGLRAARERLTGLRGQDLVEPPLAWPLAATPASVGELLAQVFLPGAVGAALTEVIAGAQGRWTPVRLGIDAAGPLRALPWETLALPGTRTPLALHPLVVAYRRQASDRRVDVGLAPGPLRIVIAISAPLAGGGGVLDYERELRNMLAAVRGARQGQARVRIVHFATTAEIRAALTAEPVHVLHVSGHGQPGLLELEDDEGNARVLDAERFIAEAIPPGRMPPVIAISACHSDAATSAEGQSFAATLVAHGAAAVIGTETAVTDVYATRVFARIYGELAEAAVPDVVAAVAQARRAVQQQLSESADRRDQHLARLGEWAVLTVRAASGSVPVFDPAAKPGDLDTLLREPRVPAGLLARGTGEFVGRRRAQRRWPGELLAPGESGLVLHGIGGVGKTTLAAELVRRITEREPGRLPVVAASGLSGGQVTVDQVFTTLARALRQHSPNPGSTFYKVSRLAERPDLDWQERLEILREHVLDTMPLLIVLDNFEDNLTADGGSPARPERQAVADQDLADLLAVLATRPGQSRLLITTRYPFALPAQADRALAFRPIGPLTKAETMKLAWALPALDRLTEAELEYVWRMVGGHPRCLEYIDALLSGGRSSYPDVTARLAANLAGRSGIPDLSQWFAARDTLKPALAETLTLAADDILLDQLLTGLATSPGAEDLLLGLSVYRSPVDLAGLLFQVGTPDPDFEIIPARAAWEQIRSILESAGIDPDQAEGLDQLPDSVREELGPHLAELNRPPTPPFRAPDDLPARLEACSASSLLAIDSDSTDLFVHRWSASELQARWTRSGRAEDVTAAHQRAAAYWQWRVEVWPQAQAADLDDLTEARHHLFAAGQTAGANNLTWAIANTLHDQGAWDREDALIRDTLTRLPQDFDDHSNWARQLADIARGRGRIAEATGLYQQALALDRQKTRRDPANTGYQRDLSVSYERLADLAAQTGDPGQAARLYQQSLTIAEQLAAADPANTTYQRDLSVSYGRLAGLARDADKPREAAEIYKKAIGFCERLYGTDHPLVQALREADRELAEHKPTGE